MKVRMVWDLPISAKVFEELGEVIYTISKYVSSMELELADSEGMVFNVEPMKIAVGVTPAGDVVTTDRDLKKVVNELNCKFDKVSIWLES